MNIRSTVLARAAVLALLSNATCAVWAGTPAMTPLDMDSAAAALKDSTTTKLSHGLLGMHHGLAKAATNAASTASNATPRRTRGGLQALGPAVANGMVRVEILPSANNTEPLLRELSGLGATAVKASGNLVHAWVPLSALAPLGSSQAVTFVREGGMAVTHAGPVVTQGDAGQRSNAARAQFGVNGSGATVGILSDSYNVLNGAAVGVSQGELPGPGNPNGFSAAVNVLAEGPPGATDEGRAMAEIVHDVAPGARLSFYAPTTYADHADGIRRLVAAGATVVVDDIGWFFEPWFQEGPIAKAAADVARSNNVTVLSSAGNSGNLSVDTRFFPSAVNELSVDGSPIGRWLLHGFDYGSSVTTPVVLNPGSRVALVLQWDEPAASVTNGGAGARSDLDLFIFDDAAGTEVAVGAASNNIGGDPVEAVILNLPAGAAGPVTVYLGHANSPALVTTCAVRYDAISAVGGPRAESFSSLGGTRVTRDANGRTNFFAKPVAKPDLCAPDGGNNSFFGFDYEGDGKPNFFGTSAAAPHAAGVVALMQSAKNMQLSPAAVKSILLRSTIDMDDPATPQFDFGFDFKTGFGFLDALTAVTNARNSR
jgi:Subtilase family